MVLAMSRPTKHPKTGTYLFRKRVPCHLQQLVGSREVKRSLGTKDPRKAKRLYLEVAEAVEREWALLQAAPVALTHKEIMRLAGVAYSDIVSIHPDNPGPVSVWEQHIRISEEARAKGRLEQWVGPYVDALLVREGVKTTTECRLKIIEETDKAVVQAARQRLKEAQGDYRPDPDAGRFPVSKTGSQSLTKLGEAWHKAALDRGARKRDADRTKRRFEVLIKFLGHDDASRVAKRDIVRWKDQRLAGGISIKTINDSDIASFNSVFNWGVEREWLPSNPADKTKIKTARKRAETREKYFLPGEAAKILKHAAAVTRSRQENPKTTAAKRWVPWLCAYSGARVAEMIQLRKQDVRRDRLHGWIIRLTPEAGSIKNNQYCDVPVHEHLIATGFIAFVEAAKDGHLFFNPGKDGDTTGPAGGVYKRVYSMVRELAPTDIRQPNHAWRYTFKTYGLEAGIVPLTLDAIANHSPRTKGEEYMKVTPKTRADAMAKFPRYDLAATDEPEPN